MTAEQIKLCEVKIGDHIRFLPDGEHSLVPLECVVNDRTEDGNYLYVTWCSDDECEGDIGEVPVEPPGELVDLLGRDMQYNAIERCVEPRP